jgi:ATP-binding cassette subfamily B protein
VTEAFRLRWALVRLMPSVSRPLTLALVVINALRSAAPVGFTIASGTLVGAVPAAVDGGLGSPAGERLTVALVVAATLFVVRQVLDPLHLLVGETLSRRINGDLRRRAMRATSRPHGLAHLEDPETLNKVSLAVGALDGQWTPGQAMLGLTNNTAFVVQAAGQAALVATFNVPLAVGLFVAFRLLRTLILKHFTKQVNAMAGQTQALRRSTYVRDLALTPPAAKETRVFGLDGWVGGRFTRYWNEGMREVWEERRGGQLTIIASLAALAAGTMFAFWTIGRAGLNGTIDLERLAILMQAALGIGAFSIGDSDLHIAYGLAALPALDELEDLVKERSGAIRSGPRSPAGMPRQAIVFRDVRFSYPGRDDEVFAGLDLDIPAGRSLAIVGDNGAGKTTLVKLLARLYEPTSGAITVDGIDVGELDTAAWQRRIGAIFQDFIRYEMTAAANVGYGAIDVSSPERLRQAAERAGAADVIDRLPKGWDTPLSRRLTDGVDLSGGEWQRIALARAIYAVDAGAGVLVLDEPTANLDVRAEAEIYDRFLELTRGITTIVISHRFSTVRRADRIVVLDAGRIVEDGTHDELLAARGRYARMFSLQAARFTDAEETAGA